MIYFFLFSTLSYLGWSGHMLYVYELDMYVLFCVIINCTFELLKPRAYLAAQIADFY